MLNPTSRTAMANFYATQAPWCALTSTAPTATAGTEISGGSPAYARRASNWGAGANSAVVSTPAAHDVPSGTTVAGVQYHSAQTAGTYWDGVPVTAQSFSSQGTYAVTATFTQA